MTILIIFLCLTVFLYAQKIKTVSATAVYYAPESISVAEARRIALERAKIEAIANEFGTIITQSNETAILTTNNETNNFFISTGGSDIKGEWIETIDEPKFKETIEDGVLVVSCYVKGKAREIVSARIDFIAKPLKNGTELRFEGYDFKSGDDLFLYFKSPLDGYLATYLVDNTSDIVYCILPYRNSNGDPKKIKADKEYILFSQINAEPDENKFVDEYKIIATDNNEWNILYILFSSEPFNKASLKVNEDQSIPKTSNLNEFHKWLAKERINNPKLNLQKIIISIRK